MEASLQPLTPDDALAVAQAVHQRYRQTIKPAIWQALAGKYTDRGEPASGNPLWLTLAAEELNLLDQDAFELIHSDRYRHIPDAEQRLAQLKLDLAASFPPDVPRLYGLLLDRAENVLGPGTAHWARSFAALIAIARAGWRESDLRDLMPRIWKKLWHVNDAWDDLKFATIRRAFRGHVVQRGWLGQWDFLHTHLRAAVEARIFTTDPPRAAFCAQTGDFLETLPVSDPIIRLERMWQLIGEGDALRAARYYATLAVATTSVGEERTGSTWTLVDWIVEGEARRRADSTPEANEPLAWVRSWLDEPALSPADLGRTCNNLQFGLFEKLADATGLALRHVFIQSVHEALERLAAQDPGNAGWQRDLALRHNEVGDALMAQGNLGAALEASRHGDDIFQVEGIEAALGESRHAHRELLPPSIRARIGDVEARKAT